MSAGPLTDLTQAVVKSNATQLLGKVVSRPALLVTDGKAAIYACDVDVGETTPMGPGLASQTFQYLEGVPGSNDFQETMGTLAIGTILRNVPIAPNNLALQYADVGNSVILTRTGSGQWQITGFANEMPGTHVLIPVNLKKLTIGPILDVSLDGRLLTLGEIGIYGGGFGVCPFGASGIFVGGTLVEIIG